MHEFGLAYALSVALSVLVGGCASRPTFAEHSVAVGGQCNYDSDCILATDSPTGITECPCGTCTAVHGGQLLCGSPPVACTAAQTCSSLGGPMGGCIAEAGVGESCAATECLSGLYCNGSSVCAAGANAGGACTPTIEESCAAPAFCDATTDTCAAPGGPGAACDWLRIERSECVPGTACSLVLGTCVVPLDDGAACSDDDGCRSHYCTGDHVCDTRSC